MATLNWNCIKIIHFFNFMLWNLIISLNFTFEHFFLFFIVYAERISFSFGLTPELLIAVALLGRLLVPQLLPIAVPLHQLFNSVKRTFNSFLGLRLERTDEGLPPRWRVHFHLVPLALLFHCRVNVPIDFLLELLTCLLPIHLWLIL